VTLTGQARTASALLEAKHDTNLADFLADRRANRVSYERIAQELNRITDGAVAVTGETIRNWINDVGAVA
jgi:hypothetical protein